MSFPVGTRILVADDTALMRRVIATFLRDLGFTRVTEVCDGEAAWKALAVDSNAKDPFQLVICDWNMPKMTGIAVLKKLRAHPELEKTPFLMITAETEKEHIMEAIQAGVSGYIVKPFTQVVFAEKLKIMADKLKATNGT